MLTELRKTSIVQLACERTGIGRSTYYKWRADDNVFARAADRALEAGKFLINDMAESKLIKLMQDNNLKAIRFWLQHNHPKYTVVNRFIHEYELRSQRPSVEDINVAEQQMLEMASAKLVPKYSTEELKEKIENELKDSELNIEDDKRLRDFEEE